MSVRVRLLVERDAGRLAELYRSNRDFLAPYEPVRPENWFTEEGQRTYAVSALEAYARDRCWPGVILTDSIVVGRINLNTIVRGAAQMASMGYWVAAEHNGRGLATAAVSEVLRLSWTELGLHRVEAGTLIDNVASQRVLIANGFTRIGVAERYLNVAGRWQDHVLYQRLAPGG